MRSRSRVVVAASGRLETLDCRPPLTVRRVHADAPDVCALCVVNSAAGPLAGDDIALDLLVCDGATATLAATGATLAQGGGGARTVTTTVTVGAGARLTARPQPVIAARDSHVDVVVRIDLADDAALEWHEVLVLGRTGEPPGAATLRWDVTRAGRPVLRQFVDLADPLLAAWPGTVAGRRVLTTTLRTDPALDARTTVHDRHAVTARLDAHTELTTTLRKDTSSGTMSA